MGGNRAAKEFTHISKVRMKEEGRKWRRRRERRRKKEIEEDRGCRPTRVGLA